MNHVLSWERIAKKEGKKEALHEVAVRLLKNGIGIDTIIEYTHLSKEEIEKLAATVK
ncbi:MAG: hypothetical protein QG657_4197 [Acidobacteriota bacterium]|nr:hypothetical protein [Acidobacteriota bacterium]